MSQSTVAGHPLHPMLIVVPAALIPFGFILDAMYRSTGKESYSNAAYYSLVGGLAGGLAAGVAGAMDYLTIAPGTDVKRTANVHASLNGGALVLSALSVLGVAVSGWFGARMVYEQGMRVEGLSPVAQAPEVKLPFDELVHRAMTAQEKTVPPSGPVLF